MWRTMTMIAAAGAAAFGLASTASAAGAAAPTPTDTHSSTPTTSCSSRPWQPEVQGTPPNFNAGERGGDYLWKTSTGFHLRVTHRNDYRAVYSGVITSTAPMTMKPVRLEGGDIAALSASRKTLVFRFADYGHIDGIDFVAPCTPTLHVGSLRVGSAALTPSRVYLGATRHHPRQTPFTLHRV